MQQYHLDISMPVALEQSFTYLAAEKIPSGCRVTVPFGERNRQTVGVVLGISQKAPDPAYKLKAILARLDEIPIYSSILLDLARWMSSYYMHPLGEVLRTMLPASRVKTKTSKVVLTESGKLLWKDQEDPRGALFRLIWKKASGSCSLKIFKTRMEEGLAAGLPKVTLARLQKDGLVLKEDKNETRARGGASSKTSRPDAAEDDVPTVSPVIVPQVLTAEQRAVYQKLVDDGITQAQSKPFLLHGVTGAGKTEVYLHLIAKVLEQNPQNQVLVMVPEIALTPQMTRIFKARFPDQVSVVHSAMADTERWAQMEAIRNGERQILIGPRSSVFAAFVQLKLLIVDEEHDSSYKQTTGLTYNGRDVAVMRGYLEKAVVVLGSATPSLESYANAQQGKYNLLELPNRVHGRGLPDVQLIQASIEQAFARRLSPRGQVPRLLELPIDPRIVEALRANHARGMQAMVIVNRRGFAYFLFSLRERKAVSCPHCSISMTVHKNSSILRCHYCDFSQRVDDLVAPEERDAFVMVGYGSEQMELYLREALPGARIQRVDSDTVGNREALPTMLNDFREGRIDVLVGTQMLAKGHDFARVTLICILEVDQVLNLPDFRAGERAFQLMVQASGRAGRGEHSGCVMIQTQKPDHPILQAGIQHDFQAFWQDQEPFRRQHGYPPFGRMILFEYSGTRKDQLDELMRSIDRWISESLKRSASTLQALQVLGPAVPPIEMIRGRLRRTLLLVSADRKILAWFAQQLRSAFAELKGDLRLRIDVDPQSLM
ncbi:MAG TPA: primosomal protein N' [Oligoflexus sp.]|uniref:replication restart helicase PriA n=1 Tax=Oligoflexus sp. TaxID=1971216 RepID=UPI002D5FD146|nr:primosomal protein N' [Oligoflexus sp.]HYX39177.1 primosomal protein N' [Oligoflexus sp.]